MPKQPALASAIQARPQASDRCDASGVETNIPQDPACRRRRTVLWYIRLRAAGIAPPSERTRHSEVRVLVPSITPAAKRRPETTIPHVGAMPAVWRQISHRTKHAAGVAARTKPGPSQLCRAPRPGQASWAAYHARARLAVRRTAHWLGMVRSAAGLSQAWHAAQLAWPRRHSGRR